MSLKQSLVIVCLLAKVIKETAAMISSNEPLSCDEIAHYLSSGKVRLECAKTKPLGAGASGVAYLLRDTDTNKQYVGKAVRVNDRDGSTLKFTDEVLTLNALRGHDNVIELFGYSRAGNFGLMLLEYGEEGTLEDLIEQQTDLAKSPKLILMLFWQILRGLLFIHTKRFVHVDLKPANIVMGQGMVPKIIDFDLATNVGASGFTRGTPYYIDSAHLTSKKTEHDQFTDIHSAGVILYEMATGGKRPFEAQTVEDLIRVIVKGKYEFSQPILVHRAVAYLIHKCLNLDRKKRMTVQEMIQFIKERIDIIPDEITDDQVTAITEFNGLDDLKYERFFKEGTSEKLAEEKESIVLLNQDLGEDGIWFDDDAVQEFFQEVKKPATWKQAKPIQQEVRRERRETLVAQDLTNKVFGEMPQGPALKVFEFPEKRIQLSAARRNPPTDPNKPKEKTTWVVTKPKKMGRVLSKADDNPHNHNGFWGNLDAASKALVVVSALLFLGMLVTALLKSVFDSVRLSVSSSKTNLTGNAVPGFAEKNPAEPLPISERAC